MIRCIDRPDGPLDDLPDPPAKLWVRGALPSGRSVAIVGTRRADAAGKAFARRLACDLARASIGVISGGAHGIDAAAHAGALDGGGSTWVVAPTPLDDPYPRAHRDLFDRIVEGGGGLLAERAPGSPTFRACFLQRNRIIAALADAVVVVQAPLGSGALSTAKWARRLDRPLLVVPASPWDPRGEGCVALLRRGAQICGSSADLADVLEIQLPLRGVPASRPTTLEPELEAVLAALGARPRPVDELVRATGLGVVRVRIALVQLAARDLADRCADGWLAVA